MNNLTPSRLAARSSQDLQAIKDVLQQTLFCTISYVVDGNPYAIPNGFCLMDNQLIIHGSVKSRFLDSILKTQQVCISSFIFDGLVLATSAFEHSVNYRSVVIFSRARELEDQKTKIAALKAFTDKYIPNRWAALRPITKGELKGTRVIAFNLEQASMKHRTGPPNFTEDEWMEKVWTGVIPACINYEAPIQKSNQNPMPIPDHIIELLNSNAKHHTDGTNQ